MFSSIFLLFVQADELKPIRAKPGVCIIYHKLSECIIEVAVKALPLLLL